MTDQLRSQPISGHDEAQGYAASLREMGAFYYVDFDELRAAADFIERQAAALAAAVAQPSCIFEVRNMDGSIAMSGTSRAWCRVHGGFDCAPIPSAEGK
jgi:hypothetical protein